MTYVALGVLIGAVFLASASFSQRLVERVTVERVTGIEPAWPAWKAGALPLSYTRASFQTRVSLGHVP